ncbi:DUF1517 domain-containing protein [Leptolyngbya sp. AN03gr2]|uniref:DUF1517 domain-containing protein n=1 Tax=unclassified Leptolyngbya TaxID=2650499 RepID=UPI003D313DFA
MRTKQPKLLDKPSESIDDQVSITTVQIAVLEQCPAFQKQVNTLIEDIHSDNSVRAAEGIKDIALLLQRNQTFWTHAKVYTLYRYRDEADQAMNHIIAEERAKFTSDSYTSQFGKVQYANTVDSSNVDASEPGHVWIITLVVGLEYSQVPGGNAQSREDLYGLLTWIRSLNSETIPACSISFMPDVGPALGQDEFVEKYPDLMIV